MEKIKEIPDESIDCIISSPPYWGLRDYGVDGQWGLEKDFHEYLDKMDAVMVELKRVLKKTGTCWINLGDSYGSHRSNEEKKHIRHKKQEREIFQGYEKSRLGIPERFYIRCIDNGWVARNHIPWVKSNAMPSSVKDRFTNMWESVFFFAKSTRYYFNLDNVRVTPKTQSEPFNRRVREAKAGKGIAKLGEFGFQMADWEDEAYDDRGVRKQDATLGADGKPKPTHKGFNDRWNESMAKKKTDELLGRGKPLSKARIQAKIAAARDAGLGRDSCLNNPKGKNPRDVFFITPQPFPEAHFATFPEELPLTILRCACPPHGTVLDPFFGSGTVGVAAEQMAMNWVGIELKEEYIKIARRRLEPYMNVRLA